LSIGANDILQGLWDTIVGGDGTIATPGNGKGNYIPAEGPPNAFDGSCNNKFLSFGYCSEQSTWTLECGANTGFTVTLASGAAVMKSFQVCTGNDRPDRDPEVITLEGTNSTGSDLLLGSSWTLIYNGPSGLEIDPGRNQLGRIIRFRYNDIAYSSYRLLVQEKRGVEYCTQLGELYLYRT